MPRPANGTRLRMWTAVCDVCSIDIPIRRGDTQKKAEPAAAKRALAHAMRGHMYRAHKLRVDLAGLRSIIVPLKGGLEDR